MRFRFRIPFIAVLVVLPAALAVGQGRVQDRPSLAPELLRSVRAEVERERSRLGIPGLSVAIIHGQTRWTDGFGIVDLEHQTHAVPQSVYRLASVAKPMTAVGVMQLVESGKIDLDADVRKYVASFPEKEWVVTPRHLISHLGGVRAYRPGEIDSVKHYTNIIDPLAIFSADKLETQPGTRYHYSTYGYNLLGAALEGAAGQGFVSYLNDHVFKPSGMTHTRDDNARAIIPNRARGYRRDAKGKIVPCNLADTSNKIPGGGLCATAADVAAFGAAFLEGKLVRRATRDQMLVAQKTSDGKPTTYGLGWGIGKHEGIREVLHTGGQPGTSTILYLRPQDGLSIAILSNLEGADLKPLARSIAQSVTAGSKVPAAAK